MWLQKVKNETEKRLSRPIFLWWRDGNPFDKNGYPQLRLLCAMFLYFVCFVFVYFFIALRMLGEQKRLLHQECSHLQKLMYSGPHTYTYTHTPTHTQTHIHAHTHINPTLAHTLTHERSHGNTQTHAQTQTQTHTQTHTHTHTHTHTRIC